MSKQGKSPLGENFRLVGKAAFADWYTFLNDATDIPAQYIESAADCGISSIAGAYGLPVIVRSSDKLPTWAMARASSELAGDLKVTVGVPERQRGIHLSRLAELAVELSQQSKWECVGHFISSPCLRSRRGPRGGEGVG